MIFQAFEKYTKLPNAGYSSISNVKSTTNQGFRDKMESFFLAETLKYFYLLFADGNPIIPLDKYVFNSEAHPLPIYDSWGFDLLYFQDQTKKKKTSCNVSQAGLTRGDIHFIPNLH